MFFDYLKAIFWCGVGYFLTFFGGIQGWSYFGITLGFKDNLHTGETMYLVVGAVLLIIGIIISNTASIFLDEPGENKWKHITFVGHFFVLISQRFAMKVSTTFVTLVMGIPLWIMCAVFGVGLFLGGLGGGSKNNSGNDNKNKNEFDISSIPFIVYDDSNRQWKRRGIFGDHAVYYNDDGGEVTIYSAQVSGNSANTSAGTLHWY